MKKWKVLKSERVFDHKWFKAQKDTVQLPNGKVLDDYFYFLHGDVSMIVPVTPNNEIVMVKQYRITVDDFLLEIPSGMIDEGEEPLVAAKREMEEETGYVSNEIEPLGKLVSMPGKVVADFYIYLAKDVRLTNQGQHLDENEDLELVVLPVKEVLAKIKNGEIYNAYMITAIYFACQKLGIDIN